MLLFRPRPSAAEGTERKFPGYGGGALKGGEKNTKYRVKWISALKDEESRGVINPLGRNENEKKGGGVGF